MNEIIESLKYLLPCLVVFITAYTLIRLFLDDVKAKAAPIQSSSSSRKEFDTEGMMKLETQKILLPLKLQACERVTLFLERINPESLIMRVHRSGMTTLDIQRELLRSIREEFEHNLSQQIYLTPNTWEFVKNAKDEITKLVKLAGSQVEGSASALAYSEMFLKMAGQLSQLPTTVAIERVKNEVKHLV